MATCSNIRRDDDVLTCAFKAERLLARLGDIEEVALAFGKSITTIRNWTLLAAAGDVVHDAVRGGKISAGAAIELVRSAEREDVAGALEGLLEAHSDPVSVAQAKLAATAAADAAEAASDTGDNAAQAPVKTEAKKTKTKTTSATKQQAGIRRVWLRRALKTEAAKHLAADQRDLLSWFANGQAKKGTWYDDFVFDAEAELDSGLQSKADKAVAKTPAEVLPEPVEVEVEAEPVEAEPAQEELDEASLLAELREIVNTPLPDDDENTDENTNKDEE